MQQDRVGEIGSVGISCADRTREPCEVAPGPSGSCHPLAVDENLTGSLERTVVLASACRAAGSRLRHGDFIDHIELASREAGKQVGHPWRKTGPNNNRQPEFSGSGSEFQQRFDLGRVITDRNDVSASIERTGRRFNMAPDRRCDDDDARRVIDRALDRKRLGCHGPTFERIDNQPLTLEIGIAEGKRCRRAIRDARGELTSTM